MLKEVIIAWFYTKQANTWFVVLMTELRDPCTLDYHSRSSLFLTTPTLDFVRAFPIVSFSCLLPRPLQYLSNQTAVFLFKFS